MSRAGHRAKTSMPDRHRVGSIGWCTPGMGMNLWGGSPLSEDLTSTMLTILKTSRRQGQHREGLSEGRLMLLHNLHFRHPWRSEAGVQNDEPMDKNRIQG